MNVGIISHTSISNYGATLQAYALKKVLGKMGHESKVLDYRMPMEGTSHFLRMMHPSYAKHAPLAVAAGIPAAFVRKARFEGFRRHYLDRTRAAYTCRSLARLVRPMDVVVSGSDEVFRVSKNGNLFPRFMLDFADPRRQRLVAYAASSGETSDYGAENERAKGLLSRFHNISVRDEVTRQLVKRLTGRDPVMVLDPTLLWKFSELPLPDPGVDNYVLVYGFFRLPETDKMIRSVADRLGARVVSTGWASRYAHVNALTADPLRWLSLVKNARMVFTNRFHGMIFSICFGRSFLIYESDVAVAKIHDFISRFSLSAQLIPNRQAPSSSQLSEMDHNALKRRIAPYQEASMTFLQGELAKSNTDAASGAIPTREQRHLQQGGR